MFSWFSAKAIFRYVRDLGPGRVAVGVLVGLLLGGSAIGVLAASSGGARSAVSDAVRPSGSDDDDHIVDDAITPTPDGFGGDDDGPGTAATPTSVAGPTSTPSPTDALSPISTPSPTPALSPTVVPSPTSVPSALSAQGPASPASPASP